MDVIAATTDEKPQGSYIKKFIFWQCMVFLAFALAFQITGKLDGLAQQGDIVLSWQVCGNLGACTMLFGFIGFINGFCIRPAAPRASIYNCLGGFWIIATLLLHNILVTGPQILNLSHAFLSLVVFLLGTGMALLIAELGGHLRNLKAADSSEKLPSTL